MSTYEALLAIHILGAVTWVGSNISFTVISTRLARAGGGAFFEFGEQVEWFGVRFLTPASLLVLLTGFGMVAEGDLSLGEFWVLFALAGFLASFAVGVAYLAPTMNRINRLRGEAGGVATPEIQALLDRVFLVGRVELALLVLIVIDMAVKPGA